MVNDQFLFEAVANLINKKSYHIRPSPFYSNFKLTNFGIRVGKTIKRRHSEAVIESPVTPVALSYDNCGAYKLQLMAANIHKVDQSFSLVEL